MSTIIHGYRQLIATATLLVLGIGNAWSTAPVIYSQVANESPVRGDPGDLLLLAGYGFAATDTVVYVALTDTTQPLTHPSSVPSTSTATTGIAPTTSAANVPDSLAVSLPTVMQAGQSYALWVRNGSGEWSNGVKINDARPLWMSPDHAYVTAQVASLPRYLKVIGRNLQSKPGGTTQVKLVGPTTYTLTAADDGNPATTIEEYVANVTLPTTLLAGSYTVSVSRDGVSWVPLNGQTSSGTFTVSADPATPTVFPVSKFGCSTPTSGDATSCVIGAIAAAKNNGGGTVTFDAGVWQIGNGNLVGGNGIVVPVGVNLSGAGAGVTVLERETSWNQTTPTFTLQGGNTVQGFTFRDANTYQATSSPVAFLQLGVHWPVAASFGPTYVSNVTITHNTFDKPYYGIGNDGLPIDHLYITYNEFGAFARGMYVSGDPGNVAQPFHIDDSIVAFNTFKPGSYIDPTAGGGGQGTLASSLSAAHHVDFSANTADGTSTQYFYNPGTDVKGWRAGFFWQLPGNVNTLLVAQNNETCTGDKAGDGEAISYDSSYNWNALPAAQSVTAATSTSVTVAGPLQSTIPNTTLTVPGNYYFDFWVEVVDGPGKGQVRKIVSYPLDASGAPITPVVFTVTPAWDVIPQSTSRITVSKQYWQVYTVDNNIDQRLTNDLGQTLCTKGNKDLPHGGGISVYAQTADSAVTGNVQHDTDGIVLYESYKVPDSTLNTFSFTSLDSFVDVRGNTVDHEYQWMSDCSWSGIQARYEAGNTTGSSPPTVGYGVSISHNSVTQADALNGGAISAATSWDEGPSGTNWDLVESPLIFANTITNVNPPDASGSCNSIGKRYGINVFDSHVFHAILASNSCTSVTTPLNDLGTGSQRICSAAATNNGCECPVGALGYWKFDEGSGTTTADSSGNGNTGTLVNGPVWTSGKSGDALNFSAATSYVSINGGGNLDNLYTTGMTVTAWINPASGGAGGGGRILDKDSGAGGWFFKMMGATAVQFVADQFATAAATRTSASSIALNTWQHVAATWDGKAGSSTSQPNIHIYINGVPADGAATNGAGSPGADTGAPIAIGNNVAGTRNFNGSIDGVRIYSRMLTPQEIQSLVNGGS